MTYKFNNVYIADKYSLLGSVKYNPIIKENVDKIVEDYYFGEKSIEIAESKYQKTTFNGLLTKTKLKKEQIDLLISGDLQNQILASTLSACENNISHLGIYSACASFIEGIIIGSMSLKYNKNVIVNSSSHNLVSEKQFRFPIEYGAIRKRVNTCTASGSIAVLLQNKKSKIKVNNATIGKVKCTNHKDANDMGSAMAIACVDTLINHLNNLKKDANYYDLILTGDLGIYGVEIVKKCFSEIMGYELENIIDAGSIFYKDENIYAGSSGPVCMPLVLFDYILKQKKYKRILVIGTGSLHSIMSTNLKLPIPAVSHAIELEVKY